MNELTEIHMRFYCLIAINKKLVLFNCKNLIFQNEWCLPSKHY
jgi:hypothetical protein